MHSPPLLRRSPGPGSSSRLPVPQFSPVRHSLLGNRRYLIESVSKSHSATGGCHDAIHTFRGSCWRHHNVSHLLHGRWSRSRHESSGLRYLHQRSAKHVGTGRSARSEYTSPWLRLGLFHTRALPDGSDGEWRDHLVEPKSEQGRERRDLRRGPDRDRKCNAALLNATLFPPNGVGTNDTSGFQAAVFSTTLNVPSTESIVFNIGSDDVAFVYLDGRVVCQLGGAHIDAPAGCTSSVLTPGSHTLQLFYADIAPPQAKLTFDVTTSGISGAPLPATPVPPSILLTMTGLVSIGLFWGYRGWRTPGRNA